MLKMNSAPPYGNNPPVLANVMESDFLGNHLQALLIREPNSGSQPVQDTFHTEDILGSAFASPPRRASRGLASASREMPPSTPNRNVNHMSPGDGIFGNIVSTAATSSTIQQGRIGADGYDYFDRRSASGSSQHYHQPSPTSASIITNFGRRPSIKARHSSTLHARRTSQDQIDVMSDASSAHLSSKGSMISGSQLDRRASDGTNLTGLTSPLARSESGCSLERDCSSDNKAEMGVVSSVAEEESEVDDMESLPSTPCSPTTQFVEEAGDQTTWERFKRGAVIEPPEAEPNAPFSASWVNGEVVYPRYTSLTTIRPGSDSPGKDTIKAEGTDTRSSLSSTVTLVPSGSDGRTFRFTTRK
jgi:hypothetical protein